MTRRLPSSLPFLAPAAGVTESATMSSRSSYRGGRHQWRREFSDRPCGGRDGTGHFVTGDSHLRSVRDANLGFRPQFQPQTPPFKYPPPRSSSGQSFRGPQQQLRPRFQPLPPRYQSPPHGQSFRGPRPPPSRYGHRFNAAPPFYRDETFQPRQQFQPRSQPPPDYRIWELAKAGSPPAQFKILSYNLLAEYLAINHRGKLYFHIPRHVLDWDWRKRRIIFELGLWKADILCFQEVDRFQDLEEDLKPQGYSGIWKMRTGDPVDGCAIFWRISRFKLLHEECIEYNKLGLRDNVAQICVFELNNQQDDKDPSDSLLRLPSSNKVVVCNIHVLYNPRRGEIKLGQVRVLLDRAHAVSKHWDDAPVVLCGDFNCTPKSPLYDYISEQKLDLSDLPRDKVSGQASAEIHPTRLFTANIRPPGSADDTGGATKMPDSGEFGQLGSLSKHEEKNTDIDPTHAPSVNFSAQLTAGLKTGDSSSMTDHCGNKVVVTSNEIDTRMTHQEVGCCDGDTPSALVYCESEAQSTLPISISRLEEPSSSQDSDNFVRNLKDGTGSFGIDSCEKDICSSFSGEHNNNAVDSCEDEASLISLRGSENLTFAHVVKNDDNPRLTSEVTVSPESSLNTRLNEKLENLSLDGVDEPNEVDADFVEDSSTFLSELHDGDSSSSHGLDFEPVDEVKYSYDPSAWTPMEIETAAGSSDCTVMEHALKLRSTYTEVQALSGTRDSNGEPLATSYNRCFLGTVDYIWRSEGLQTVSVLAPIPKQAMQWTPGFPTKKWGSDHISLVSELAFADKTPSAQNTAGS